MLVCSAAAASARVKDMPTCVCPQTESAGCAGAKIKLAYRFASVIHKYKYMYLYISRSSVVFVGM